MIDILIIGAGPAGLSAAISCAKYGLKVKVIDEFFKPGGRLLGQLHQEPSGEWWNGIEEANNLFVQAQLLGVEIVLGISVYDILQTEQGWKVSTTNGVQQVPTLLLATGAAETPQPIPGWTLPGVMSIGAAQVMSNVHRVKVGQRGVVVGINVLSAAIMQELLLAGIDIAAMLLPGKSLTNVDSANPMKVMQSMQRVAHLAPSPLIKLGSKFIKIAAVQKLAVHFFPRSGLKMWGVPIHLRKAVIEIYGKTQVEGVRTVRVTATGEVIPGTESEIPVDFVCIAGGLYPLAELAAVAGCPFKYIPELGGHVPIHSNKMQTSLRGLYLAGNITGIESAKIAIAQGTVAGLSILVDRGKTQKELPQLLEKAVENVHSVRERALIQFHPNVMEGRLKMEALWKALQ